MRRRKGEGEVQVKSETGKVMRLDSREKVGVGTLEEPR
jgi:hypothetical protein